MPITSCDNCWRLPCSCGRDYENLTVPQIQDMIKELEAALGRAALKKYRDDELWDRSGGGR